MSAVTPESGRALGAARPGGFPQTMGRRAARHPRHRASGRRRRAHPRKAPGRGAARLPREQPAATTPTAQALAMLALGAPGILRVPLHGPRVSGHAEPADRFLALCRRERGQRRPRDRSRRSDRDPRGRAFDKRRLHGRGRRRACSCSDPASAGSTGRCVAQPFGRVLLATVALVAAAAIGSNLSASEIARRSGRARVVVGSVVRDRSHTWSWLSPSGALEQRGSAERPSTPTAPTAPTAPRTADPERPRPWQTRPRPLSPAWRSTDQDRHAGGKPRRRADARHPGGDRQRVRPTRGIADKLGVRVVPLTIRFGDEELVDRVELSAKEFWDRVVTGPHMPQTAAPSPGAFQTVFNEAADAGMDGVVCVNLSSKVSATYQAARTAADAVGGPDQGRGGRLAHPHDGSRLARPAKRSTSLSSARRLDEVVAGVEDAAAACPRVRRSRQPRFPAQRRPDRRSVASRRLATFDQARARGPRRCQWRSTPSSAHGRARSSTWHRRRSTRARSNGSLWQTAGRPTPARSSSISGRRRASTRSRSSILGPVVGSHTGPGSLGVCFMRRPELASSGMDVRRQNVGSARSRGRPTGSPAEPREPNPRLGGVSPGRNGPPRSPKSVEDVVATVHDRAHPADSARRPGGRLRARRRPRWRSCFCCCSGLRQSVSSTSTPSGTAYGPLTLWSASFSWPWGHCAWSKRTTSQCRGGLKMTETAPGGHRGLRSRRAHRRHLRSEGQPRSCRDRGRAFVDERSARRAADAHDRSRELPRIRRRDPRSGVDAAIPRPGGTLRRDVRRRPKRPVVDVSGEPTSPYGQAIPTPSSPTSETDALIVAQVRNR